MLVDLVTVASAADGTIAPEVLGRLTAGHQTLLKKIWADGKYHSRYLHEWRVVTKADYSHCQDWTNRYMVRYSGSNVLCRE